MTPGDMTRVLAKAAAYDQRTIGEADVLAWHEAIGDLDAEDALASVAAYYASATDRRIMPGDVRANAEHRRRERHRMERERREIETRQAEAIERGPATDRSAEVTALVREVADKLAGDPSGHKHARALLRARKDHGRPAPLARKPKKKQPPKDFPPPQSDDIAALARRYLRDGHEPNAVAETLGVSRKWCRQAVSA